MAFRGCAPAIMAALMAATPALAQQAPSPPPPTTTASPAPATGTTAEPATEPAAPVIRPASGAGCGKGRLLTS